MADELHTLLCNHIVQLYATYTCRGAYSCHLMHYITNSPQCHYETRNKEIKGRPLLACMSLK